MNGLTAHQAAAVRELGRLLRRDGVALLDGHAGTGKTYVGIRTPLLLGWPAGKVALLDPSWKAVSVCADKAAAAGLDVDYYPGALRRATFGFLRGGHPDAPGPLHRHEHHYPYVVVDEASMLRRKDFEALYAGWVEGAGRGLLLVGDVAQLPPVRSAWSVFGQDLPTVELSEPMRTDRDSGILAAALAVRAGAALGDLQPNGRDVLHGRGRASLRLGETVALVHRNDDRVRLNAEIRRAFGFTDPLHVGEILRSRHRTGRFTKEVFGRVARLGRSALDGHVRAEIALTDGQVVIVDVDLSRLDQEEIEGGGWRYGYCTTVHSAQGDEWPSVTVHHRGDEDAVVPGWAYTAVTRARRRLYLSRLTER